MEGERVRLVEVPVEVMVAGGRSNGNEARTRIVEK